MWPDEHETQTTFDKFGRVWSELHAGLATPEDNPIFSSNFKSHDREC